MNVLGYEVTREDVIVTGGFVGLHLAVAALMLGFVLALVP